MFDTKAILRPNWYDGQKVSLNDLKDEQNFSLNNTGKLADVAIGSGVVLERPTELVIFDSASLDDYQQGLVAIDAFDGRGILEAPILCSDQVEGNQLRVELTGLNLDGFQKTTMAIIGKTFDSSLVYETLEFSKNTEELSANHYIEVTNLLFNNFLGNTNTSVDGYGSLNLGGSVVVTEASSMTMGRDPLAAAQALRPDVVMRDLKIWSSAITLDAMLTEAVGSSNDVDDLDVNTTTAATREFAAGAASSLVIGQKFKMSGTNIQKVTLLLGLESGANWSGSLVVGVRKLQTSVTCTTDFLPDGEIGFDPSTETMEEVTVTQSDLENSGVVLTSTAIPVDFYFADSDLADPDRSGLEDEAYYAITIRRSGSTATGTLFMPEATNSDADLRLTIFSSSVWTDVESSSLWFKVWRDAAKVASGLAYDAGIRVVSAKTKVDANGDTVQNFSSDIMMVDTSEGGENYVTVAASVAYSDQEVHPNTGDQVFAKKEDSSLFAALSQTDAQALIDDNDGTVVIGRMIDENPRSNPTITGQFTKPGLALRNELHILNPSSDLLTHNVVGSIITPNTLQPSLRYRITSQEVFTDLYGDVDGDGVIDVADAVRLAQLDGYASDLSSGTVADATQLAAVLAEITSVPEIMRADVTGNGVITTADLAELNAFINDGTAMTAGSSFTRVLLTVEPLLNPQTEIDTEGNSTLEIHVEDPSLIDNATFSTINFSIAFQSSWDAQNLEILDLRRHTISTFLDFESSYLQASPETGGQNNLLIPGDIYLEGRIRNLDGTSHALDYEETLIELELPTGTTSGTINLFDVYVEGKMSFGDGTLVSSSAIADNQVRFATMISSYSKQLGAADFDEPSDGYSTVDIDEVIGTYIDHDTGILRLFAKNIIYNPLLPQIRTRITVIVKLKRAGFANNIISVSQTDFSTILT